MSKHTPGPWTLTEIDLNDPPALTGCEECGYRITAGKDDKLSFEILPNSERYSPGETKANALLVVNAPDLLKTLRAANQALLSYQYGNASTELAEEIAKRCAMVIAKAIGKEPSL